MFMAKPDTATAACTDQPSAAQRPTSQRFMWLTNDRVLYVGLLGAPTVRTMGCVAVYVATAGPIHFRLPGGVWQSGEVAVVPAYLPYELAADARMIIAIKVEGETVDLAALPPRLAHCGVLDDPAFAQHVRQTVVALRDQGARLDLAALNFDTLFFGQALQPRAVDPRIQGVIDAIKRDPSAALAAEDCAQSVHLSVLAFPAPVQAGRGRAFPQLPHLEARAQPAALRQPRRQPGARGAGHGLPRQHALQPFHPAGLRPEAARHLRGSRKLAIFGKTLQAA